MRSRRLLAFVVLAVLACARPAHAGWLDFIWELTGPQMIGFGGSCEMSLGRNGTWRCTVPLKALGSRSPGDHWFWISAESYYYFSLPHNGFEGGRVRMFTFDPMVSLSRRTGDTRVLSGLGLSLQRFSSADFDGFGNAAIKLRPIAVEFPAGNRLRVTVGYNLRYYWDGFESAPPVLSKSDRAEVAHGLTFAFTF